MITASYVSPHQPHAGDDVHSTSSPASEASTAHELLLGDDRQISSSAGLPWKPFYIRHRILYLFAGLFLILAVAVEALFLVSRANQGLLTSTPRLHYLWSYVPTAVFTLIAAFWGHVDFKSKVSAPWSRVLGPEDVKRALFLDYVPCFLWPYQSRRYEIATSW